MRSNVVAVSESNWNGMKRRRRRWCQNLWLWFGVRNFKIQQCEDMSLLTCHILEHYQQYMNAVSVLFSCIFSYFIFSSPVENVIYRNIPCQLALSWSMNRFSADSFGHRWRSSTPEPWIMAAINSNNIIIDSCGRRKQQVIDWREEGVWIKSGTCDSCSETHSKTTIATKMGNAIERIRYRCFR